MGTDQNQARQLVVDWLRTVHLPDATLALPDETLVLAFLGRAGNAGFRCEVTQLGGPGPAHYEVRWTHRGATFVGFQQAPAEDTPDEALLAGCAALLQNHWCRSRLEAG